MQLQEGSPMNIRVECSSEQGRAYVGGHERSVRKVFEHVGQQAERLFGDIDRGNHLLF